MSTIEFVGGVVLPALILWWALDIHLHGFFGFKIGTDAGWWR